MKFQATIVSLCAAHILAAEEILLDTTFKRFVTDSECVNQYVMSTPEAPIIIPVGGGVQFKWNPNTGNYKKKYRGRQRLFENGTPINGCDDCCATIPIGFSFPYYGQPYDTAYMSANGVVAFGQCMSAWTENEQTFTNTVGIFSLWDDFSPNIGGVLNWKMLSANSIGMQWVGVPQYQNTDQNTFQLVLNADGSYVASWHGINTNDFFIGHSGGPSCGTSLIPVSLSESITEEKKKVEVTQLRKN
jgi:hypothetical protein